jgi:hypothetical protein
MPTSVAALRGLRALCFGGSPATAAASKLGMTVTDYVARPNRPMLSDMVQRFEDDAIDVLVISDIAGWPVGDRRHAQKWAEEQLRIRSLPVYFVKQNILSSSSDDRRRLDMLVSETAWRGLPH